MKTRKKNPKKSCWDNDDYQESIQKKEKDRSRKKQRYGKMMLQEVMNREEDDEMDEMN